MESDLIKCENIQHYDGTTATRFCSKCDLFLCSDCILEYHSDHFKEAKLKINEVLSNEKQIYENMLKRTVDTERSRKDDSAEISRCIDKIEQDYHSSVKEIEQVINDLSGVLENERDLYKTVISNLIEQTNNFAKNTKYESILSKKYDLENILKKWDSKYNSEKVKIFKERRLLEGKLNMDIDEFLKEPNHIEEFKITLDLYSRKKYTEEINKITVSISDINSKINIYKEKIGNNEKIGSNEDKEETQLVIKSKSSENNNNNNISNPYPYNSHSSSPIAIAIDLKINKSNSKLLMHYDWNKKQVRIVDPNSDVNKNKEIKLTNSFLDKQFGIFEKINDPAYVNLGESILITGGNIKDNPVSQCYLLQVTKNNKYKVNVKEYCKMNEPRGSHSMIYLEDMDSVLVCGGFYSSFYKNIGNINEEITNLTQGTWKKINKIRQTRMCPILLYFNQKTVYCFGGSDFSNIYNSCECIDIKGRNSSWNYITIETEIGLDPYFIFMGIMQLEPSRLLLVGGGKWNINDEYVYNYDVLEVLIENDCNWKVSKNMQIKENIRFKNSVNFFKWGEDFINFACDLNIIKYNSFSKKLQIN